MKKRLYLSRNDKKLAGVCGGIAEYFEWDATLVRILWVLFTLLPVGGGIIAYIIAAMIMDEAPVGNAKKSNVIDAEIIEETNYRQQNDNNDDSSTLNFEKDYQNSSTKKSKDGVIIGGILIALGSYFFTRNFFNWHWMSYRYLTPIALIGIGIAVIYNGRK